MLHFDVNVNVNIQSRYQQSNIAERVSTCAEVFASYEVPKLPEKHSF